MSNANLEPAAVGAWQYIGPAPEVEARELFEDPWGKADFTDVAQGYEEVSAGNWLVSAKFAQCSARILINQADGSVLLKHVGPSAADVFDGGDTGLRSQDTYADFFEHARQTGAAVWAVNFFGDQSRHRLLAAAGVESGVVVTELPEIKIPSGLKYTWAIAHNPRTSEAIIRTVSDEEGSTYQKFQLPSVAAGVDEAGATALVRKVERRRQLKRGLEHLGGIPLSSPDFQKIDETREAVMGSASLLAELKQAELDSVRMRWEASFVRMSEIATTPEELAPGVEALKILMDASDAAQPKDFPQLRRVHALSHLVFSVVMKLEKTKQPAIAMGGPVILEHLDSEIDSLQRGLAGDEPSVVVADIQGLRNVCARILTSARSGR